MGGDRGDGGGAGATDLPLEYYKLSYISKKKNWSSGSAHGDGGILFFIFPFCM